MKPTTKNIIIGMLMVVFTPLAIAETTIAGSTCKAPPHANCPQGGCKDMFAARGEALDKKTGRHFFLDFPCDYKPGEKLTFILNLHGGGSIGNWQRHYFPAVDYVEKYRLVVASPSGIVRAWLPQNDDEHLQNIVELVYEEFGKENIRSFWFAGHSQGGFTSNRLICNDYYIDKVDGWLSLSGGRIGPAPVPDFFNRMAPKRDGEKANAKGPRPGAAVTPSCNFSYIFATGELEITELPDTSPWAEKYSCDARVRLDDIVDDKPGYVTATDQSGGPEWGRTARPGKAEAYIYPNCKDNRVVADFNRFDKGHTEGLEPKVTEEIIKLIVAAPGGKAHQQ